jgi:hypothetical protein
MLKGVSPPSLWLPNAISPEEVLKVIAKPRGGMDQIPGYCYVRMDYHLYCRMVPANTYRSVVKVVVKFQVFRIMEKE